ncbi:MAG TPA: hypothetical protein VH518_17055 [Tepidisphaeraceae bacterium]|jgi:hypothetical protein
MTMAAEVAVIDVLNSLLEAEQNSIFRFMGEGSPYLSRATAEVRRPLNRMVEAGNRRVIELADMIEALGGVPNPASIQPEEQYLAFLTLKFLLPKLVGAKKLMIQRYENALRSLGNSAPQDVVSLVNSELTEHKAELEVLNRAAAQVAAGATR